MKDFLLKGILVGILIFTFGCRDDTDCSTSSINFISLSFIDSGTFEVRQSNFDSVFAPGFDTLFVTQADSLDTLILLPVNPFETEATYVFVGPDRNEEIRIDTVVFSYFPRQGIITPECGPTQFFDDLDTISTTFDSLVVVQPRLRDFNATNVLIYN
ncbi:MAG: DUF6452 family protein [Bacteroidota bacterium]